MRKRQFSQGRIEAVEAYAAAVENEVRLALWSEDQLWRRCSGEWGQGGGFKHQVLTHISQWAKGQKLGAHQDLQPVRDAIPFWPEVARPARAPQFTLHIRNLRALQNVEWTPAPVSLLIGANGAGKTTTLVVLRLLRLAFERGLSDATRLALGGSHNLASWGSKEDEPVQIGLSVGSYNWRISLNPREGSVDPLAEESLLDGQRVVLARDSFGVLRHDEERVSVEVGTMGLRTLVDRGAVDVAIRSVSTLLQRIAVFQEPDIAQLRRQGSDASDDQELRPRGENALSVLRRWRQTRSMEYRYEFVASGLRAAFPTLFESVDFHQVGNTLSARVFRPGNEQPTWLADEANGLLQMLVLLCEVASTDVGGVVAIDEPENGLHPYALRVFLRKTRQWATQHHVTALLATHSTVLLDEFSAMPEDVFVMTSIPDSKHKPSALNQLCDPDWLAGFKLGDLYEQGEIGSNDDAA